MSEFKNVSRRVFLKGMGTAVGAIALSSAFSFRSFAQPAVVNVGAIIPFTGTGAEFGVPFSNSLKLAAEQVNKAAAQVLGGPIIKLIPEDTGTSASIGIDQARKLVEVYGVPAILGEWASGVTVPVAESVTIPDHVLQISYGSTSPLITVLPADKGQDFLFRTTASDALQGVVAAMLASGQIIKDHKFKSVATIYVNNPYGQGLSNVFSRSFQLRGGIVTAQVPHPEEPQPTYTSELALALKDKPELLVAISYPGHATVYLKEAIDIFDYHSFQFVDGTRSLKIVAALGAKAVEGDLGTAPGSDPSWGGFKEFAADYKAKYGQPPVFAFMDSAYDAVATVSLAIAKAIVDGVKITGTSLRDRLRPVSNPPGETVSVGVNGLKKGFELIKAHKDINYSGAAGACDFDKYGDVKTPDVIWKYTGGKIETVEVIKVANIPSE